MGAFVFKKRPDVIMKNRMRIKRMENKPMEKTVEYYLGLPYPFFVTPLEDGSWFVKFPDLLGCMTDADQWGDLPDRMQDAKRLWFESMLDSGHPIPAPNLDYAIKKPPHPSEALINLLNSVIARRSQN
jgi:antitoxin HicB